MEQHDARALSIAGGKAPALKDRLGFDLSLHDEHGREPWLAHLALLRGAALALQPSFELQRAIDAFQEAFMRYAIAGEDSIKPVVCAVLKLLIELERQGGHVRIPPISLDRHTEMAALLFHQIHVALLMLARVEAQTGARALRAARAQARNDCLAPASADAFRPYIDANTPRVKIVTQITRSLGIAAPI